MAASVAVTQANSVASQSGPSTARPPSPVAPSSSSQDYHNPIVLRVHYIETAAALWELIAAFGWWYTVRASLASGNS
jgi:hypothetical protein